MTASLQRVEFIGAYDAEKILDQGVQLLRAETNATYLQVNRAIQEDYEAGFASILEDYEVTSEAEVTPDQAVVDALRQNAVSLVSKWEYAGLQLMHEATLAAVRQDWSEQEFREELANILTKFQNQVDNIIRTEVNRAGNQGRLDASRYVAARYIQIYTQEDEQVCEQAITIRELGPVAGCRDFWDGKHQHTVFRVSDSVGLLPLHPRCLLKGTIVHTIQGPKHIEEIKVGELVLTHKGRYREVIQIHSNPYEGQIYEIAGNWLTSNHPILTPQGWMSVDDIQDFSQILTLSASHDRYLPLANLHSDQSPASIMEENFLAAVISGMSFCAVPFPTIDFNSNLRCREAEVDIVDIKSKLRDNTEFSPLKHSEKFLLQWRKGGTHLSPNSITNLILMTYRSAPDGFMGCLDLISSLFFGHLAPLQPFGFCSPSWGNACGFQSESDNSPSNIETFGESIFRDPPKIEANNRIHWKIDVPLSRSVFPTIRHKRAPTIQKHSDTYKGTTYNLSVAEDESFIIGAERIIVHNCRCYWSPVEIPVR